MQLAFNLLGILTAYVSMGIPMDTYAVIPCPLCRYMESGVEK